MANNFANGTSLTTLDCGFLVTSASILSNGNYEVCAQATAQFAVQSWQVWDGFAPPAIATSNLPNPCWQFSSANFGPTFTLRHVVYNTQGDSLVCFRTIFIFPDTLCEKDIVTANVKNCKLETTITIDVSGISTPYVITFGDGSLAQQTSATEITHTYSQPGTYDVCLTYTVGEIGIVTCCYPIQVVAPPACTCPADAISVLSVEPCTWVASLLFDLESAYFPISVDFGDSTSGVVNGPNVSHDYPDPGNYYVCYAYVPFPGDTVQCCEWVNIPGCCLNPYFEINAISPSPSCVNPLYRISDAECQSSIVEATHIWVFSDSTVFIGTNPPDHLFTNFIDFTGEVCVTHIIICCEDTASYTACAPHPQGAFIGTPNQQLFFTDILPFTGQTVRQFIVQNANAPWPLFIDGTLVANVTAAFGVGTWNMGFDSEVLIPGPFNTTAFIGLTLNGTVIQSAVRLTGNGGCCRWRGLHSEGRTRITLGGASLMDADYAIRYPTTLGVVSGGLFPQILSTGSFFINNFYRIKSERQFVNFANSFSGNTMNGAQENPHVCGCQSANAFDFANVNPQLTVNIAGGAENEVFNYEKAFNFNNSRLRVRNFEIHTLKDYDPVPLPFNNAPGDAAIGIDFLWSNSPNSSLNIDQIGFTNFQTDQSKARSVAVRDNITGGKHTLTASTSNQSIFIGDVAAGYELIVGSQAKISGTIKGNTINTNGGTQFGFGINGAINSADNVLNLNSNMMNISTGSSSSLNGGIVLASPAEMDQDYNILDNTIDVLLNNNGVGIGITNARGFSARRNKLLNPAGITGINLREGGAGRVDCNDVRDKTRGINANSSFEVEYSSNNLRWNKRDLIFTGDGNAVNGSLIRWNTFRSSDFESILYNPGVQTGPQLHNQYNKWHERNGNEAVHSSTSSIIVAACRFAFPFGAPPNTVMHPSSNPAALFVQNTPGVLIDSIPDTNFCTSANDAVAAMSPLDPDPAGTWASIVQDPAYWSGLTPAEQAMMRQEIYGLLLAQPNWVSSNATLSGFKSAQDASFIGQSESLRRAWQQLMNSIATHQASQASTRADLAALSDQMEGWLAAIMADPNLEANLQPQIDAAQLQSDMLAAQLELADNQFYPTVQATVSQLLMQNAAVDESTTHTWSEKRYNQIALNHLAGTAPDAAAIADLRTIAQTCLNVGGRAVMGARGLCETWLKEYYDEDNCNGLGGRSAEGAAAPGAANSLMLRIVPNPADDEVRVSLNLPNDGSSVKVQFLTLSGQEVHTVTLSLKNGELAVPVKGWHDGVYVARAIRGKETFSQTFIVQHR